MMQHNNTANTHRSLRALAIVFTSTKWGGVSDCPLIRVCSLIRSNTKSVLELALELHRILDTLISLMPYDTRIVYSRTSILDTYVASLVCTQFMSENYPIYFEKINKVAV